MQVSVNEEVLDLSGGSPRLLGSRCTDCGNHVFPVQSGCPKCAGANMETVQLGESGVLWAWTVQGFPPKSPPYLGETDPNKFQPYGVGYIEIPDQVKIEARLTESEPAKLSRGMPMRLTVVPLTDDEHGNTLVTFAFEPIEEEES